MTSYTCFICDLPGTHHLIGTVHACDDHMTGTGTFYGQYDTEKDE